MRARSAAQRERRSTHLRDLVAQAADEHLGLRAHRVGLLLRLLMLLLLLCHHHVSEQRDAYGECCQLLLVADTHASLLAP